MEDLVTEFNGTLAECFKQGQYFEIEVTPAKHFKSFHITLAEDKLNTHPGAQIGLHVQVNESEISAYTGKQLRTTGSSSRWPRKHGDVKVNIQMSDTSFHISVDGLDGIELRYDETIDHLKAIQIGGDVKLIKRVDHRQVYPAVWPPSTCIPYYPAAMDFSNDIPIRFKPGHLMVFTARCYGQPTGNFYMNLKHAHTETLLMHVSVDFNAKLVFRSHMDPVGPDFYGHGYSANQSHGGFPFDFNKPFKMGIACTEKEFLIAINGQQFCSFAYTDPENRHPEGVVARPYENVLSNIVGIKIFFRHEPGIKVTELDHIQLGNPDCTAYEKYTQFDGTAQCHK